MGTHIDWVWLLGCIAVLIVLTVTVSEDAGVGAVLGFVVYRLAKRPV